MKTIIEKELYPNLKFKNPVYVTLNGASAGNPENIIGECTVTEDNKKKCYMGEFKFFNTQQGNATKQTIEISDLYPAVSVVQITRDEKGKVISGRLRDVSIVTSNIDPTIPPIKLE